MITTNGANIFLAQITRTSTRTSIVSGSVRDTNGAYNASDISLSSVYLTKKYTSSQNGVMMHFGSGNTAESKGDYCLASDLNITPVSVNAGQDENNYFVTATATNNTGAAITISEIGITAGFYSSGKEYLMGRKVVPARVVENGESFTFAFVIEF